MYSLYGYNLVQNLQQSRASMIISFNSSATKWQMHFNLITLKIVMGQVPKIWFANTSQKILEQAFYTFLAIYLIVFQSSVSKIISVAIWRKFWQIKKCFRYVDSFQLRKWYFLDFNPFFERKVGSHFLFDERKRMVGIGLCPLYIH